MPALLDQKVIYPASYRTRPVSGLVKRFTTFFGSRLRIRNTGFTPRCGPGWLYRIRIFFHPGFGFRIQGQKPQVPRSGINWTSGETHYLRKARQSQYEIKSNLLIPSPSLAPQSQWGQDPRSIRPRISGPAGSPPRMCTAYPRTCTQRRPACQS